MKVYDSDYQKELRVAWRELTNGNDNYDYSFMRQEILQSWRMSLAYSVVPVDNVPINHMTQEQFLENAKKNASLLQAGRGEADRMYSLIQNSNIYIMLADRAENVIYSVGDEKILKLSGPHTRLLPGFCWSMQEAGTNAISFCNMMRKPVQVYGAEHYVYRFKDYTCSCAPIFDFTGELIGFFCITALYGEVSSHTLGLVTAAATNIEKELALKLAYRELNQISLRITAGEKSNNSLGILLLSPENRIAYASDDFLSILGEQHDTLSGKYFTDVLEIHMDNEANSHIDLQQGNLVGIRVIIANSAHPERRFPSKLSIMHFGNLPDMSRWTLMTAEPITSKTNWKKLGEPKTAFLAAYTFDSIVGRSKEIQRTIAEGRNIARSRSNVLIMGETGTGKELFAQSIHNASPSADGPFVAINCAAIPNNLVESELFGYEPGAFTGADRSGKIGKFELASNGTLFLDEIGDMPLDIQGTLLRVLEERQFFPVGSTKPKQMNARIIAATNRNLEEEVSNKRFRGDLYYRLNVLSIQTIPLRQRIDDIDALLEFFIYRYISQTPEKVFVTDSALLAMQRYSWPGNVRELENVVERLSNTMTGNVIDINSLPMHIRILSNQGEFSTSAQISRYDQVAISSTLNESRHPYCRIGEAHEKEKIIEALRNSQGHMESAAQELGMNLRTLYRRVKKYEIDCRKFR